MGSTFFETLACLPGELHLQVNKSILPVQQVPRKISVTMKEEKNEQNWRINWTEDSSKIKSTNWLEKHHGCSQETTKQETSYLY